MIKAYLLPFLVDERKTEPIFMEKANQPVSFNFGTVQLLDTLKFLGSGSFIRADKTKGTKLFFPYEC